MIQVSFNNSVLAGGRARSLWLVVVMSNAAATAPAQQALRNTLANESAAKNNTISLESLPYTFKTGDFKLLLTPSFETDWNDNINLSKSNQEQDFILRPTLQVNSSYPITQANLLQLNVTAGYDKYLEHYDYSNWRVQSGSQLSFDTYVKDVLINLHERFDYTEDAGAQPVVAGSGEYGSAHNTAGLTLTWNPENLNLSLGYDHQNVMSPEGQFQAQDSTSELIDGRIGWRFAPATTAGIEATYSSTAYDQAVLNNNSSYTIGGYGIWRPGSYFNITPRAGYSIFQFQQTSQSAETFYLTTSGAPIVVATGTPVRTSDLNSWYADVTLSHDITRALTYSLSFGHEIQPGVQADAVEDSYLRLSLIWKVIKNLDINSSFSYEHGQQGAGNVSGNLTENFDWYTGSLAVSRQLTKKLRLGLTSRYTLRSSTTASLGYTQAMVGLQMAYALE